MRIFQKQFIFAILRVEFKSHFCMQNIRCYLCFITYTQVSVILSFVHIERYLGDVGIGKLTYETGILLLSINIEYRNIEILLKLQICRLLLHICLY